MRRPEEEGSKRERRQYPVTGRCKVISSIVAEYSEITLELVNITIYNIRDNAMINADTSLRTHWNLLTILILGFGKHQPASKPVMAVDFRHSWS